MNFTGFQVKVLLTLVYSDTREGVLEWKSSLEEAGAIVALFQSKEVACVTASQTVRLITPHIHNSVLTDEDIIVTADVDAFIMTPDILKPLQD